MSTRSSTSPTGPRSLGLVPRPQPYGSPTPTGAPVPAGQTAPLYTESGDLFIPGIDDAPGMPGAPAPAQVVCDCLCHLHGYKVSHDPPCCDQAGVKKPESGAPPPADRPMSRWGRRITPLVPMAQAAATKGKGTDVEAG